MRSHCRVPGSQAGVAKHQLFSHAFHSTVVNEDRCNTSDDCVWYVGFFTSFLG